MSPEDFKQGHYFFLAGDSKEYIDPVENLLKTGEHKTADGSYAKRTPGYTPVYLMYRLFLDKPWALNITLFFQVILSAISCYILALLASSVFKSPKLFFWTFWLYTISTYVSIWDNYVLTESFATSSLIFCLYALHLFVKEKNWKWLLFSGLMLTWCVFLRPYMAPFLGLLSLFIFLNTHKSLKTISVSLLVFLSPMIISEISWVARNYRVMKEFVPLQSNVSYNDKEAFNSDNDIKPHIADFVKAFGGDLTWWNPRGESYWFFNGDVETSRNIFPSIIFNDSLNFERLKEVKRLCIEGGSNSLSKNQLATNKEKIRTELKSFHDTYVNEHPIHFLFVSRLIHIKNFVFHSGVYNIPFEVYEKQTVPEKLTKTFYALLYLFTMTLGWGFLIIFLSGNIKPDSLKLYFMLIPVWIIILFPIVFKTHEYRFSTLSYPFLLVMMCLGMLKLIDIAKQKGLINFERKTIE